MSVVDLRVPDDQLDYDEDLVYTYRGERFTGIGYDEAPGHSRSEISYVNGVQEGPARDWYPSGRLKFEAMYKDNARHGHRREFREDGTISLEEIYEYGVLVRSASFDVEGRVLQNFEISEDSANFNLLRRLRERFG